MTRRKNINRNKKTSLTKNKPPTALKNLGAATLLFPGIGSIPLGANIVKVHSAHTGNPTTDKIINDQSNSINNVAQVQQQNAWVINQHAKELDTHRGHNEATTDVLKSQEKVINRLADELSEVKGKAIHKDLKEIRRKARRNEGLFILGYSLFCLAVIWATVTYAAPITFSLIGSVLLIGALYIFEERNSQKIINSTDQTVEIFAKGVSKIPLFDNEEGKKNTQDLVESIRDHLSNVDSITIGNKSYRLAFFGLLLAAQIGAAVSVAIIQTVPTIQQVEIVNKEASSLYRLSDGRVLILKPTQ